MCLCVCLGGGVIITSLLNYTNPSRKVKSDALAIYSSVRLSLSHGVVFTRSLFYNDIPITSLDKLIKLDIMEPGV